MNSNKPHVSYMIFNIFRIFYGNISFPCTESGTFYLFINNRMSDYIHGETTNYRVANICL